MMSRIKKTLVIIYMATFFCPPAWGQVKNFGSADYLREGAGSRACGMGGAFVALADDATAGYWNPAGLSQMELYMYQAAAQYAMLPNEMNTSFLSYAFVLPEIGSFSVAWMNFSAGNIESRDADGAMLPALSDSENTFYISFGRKVYPWVKGLSVGASLKVLQQNLGEFSALGHGLDLGVLWQPVMAWEHTLGVNVQNIYQRQYWNQGGATDFSLLNVKVGTALKFLRSEEELYFNHLIATLDMDLSEYARTTGHLGVEYWPWRNLGLRAGYGKQEITAGASYRPENFEVDYAFVYDLSEVKAHQHRLSLLLRFQNDKLASSARSALGTDTEAQEKFEIPAVVKAYSGVTEPVTAAVLEVQRVGGRVSRVILNKGSEDQIKVGFQGSLLDPSGVPLAGFTIRQVDPKLSLADVIGLSRDFENNITAVIQMPVK
jgi:hypothetical protein